MRRLRPFATLAFALLGTSCFAVTNLDRFKQTSGATGDFQDLSFTMRGAVPHLTNLFEYRVIDHNNIIQSRGVYNPLGAADTTVNVAKAVQRVNGPYRLDFYADRNFSGGWDGLNTGDLHDHGWRIDPLVSTDPAADPNGPAITIVYDHNLSFTELNEYPVGTVNPPKDPGVNATIHFANIDVYKDKLFEARIADANGHTSGMYRVAALTTPTPDGTVGGIIDPEVEYDVTVYVDANGNGVYDNPAQNAGDHGFKVHLTSTATGLAFTFDPSALGDHTVDVGPP